LRRKDLQPGKELKRGTKKGRKEEKGECLASLDCVSFWLTRFFPATLVVFFRRKRRAAQRGGGKGGGRKKKKKGEKKSEDTRFNSSFSFLFPDGKDGKPTERSKG